MSRSGSSPHVRFQDELIAGAPCVGSSLLETEAEREVHSLQKLLLETKQHLKESEHERRSSMANLHESFPRRDSTSGSSDGESFERRGSWLSHVNSIHQDQIEGLERKIRSSDVDNTPAKVSVDAMWQDWKAASPQLRMSPAVVEARLPDVVGKPIQTRDACGRKNSHSLCQDELRKACDTMADVAKQDMLALESELLEFTRAMEHDFDQEKAATKAEMEQMRSRFRTRQEALESELISARKEKDKIQTKLQEDLLTATQRNGRVALELSEEIQKRKRLERELNSWKDQAATMQQALECSDVRVGALEHALASAMQNSAEDYPGGMRTDVSTSSLKQDDHSLSPNIVEPEVQAQWDVEQEGDDMLGEDGAGGLFAGGIDEAERVLAMVGEEHAKEVELLEQRHAQAMAAALEERNSLMAQVTALKSQWAYQHHQAVKLRGLKEHGFGGVDGGLAMVVEELRSVLPELAGLARVFGETSIITSIECDAANSEQPEKPTGRGKEERSVHVPLYSPSASPSGGQNPAGNPATPCAHGPDGNGQASDLKGSERGPNNAHRQSVCSFGLPEEGLELGHHDVSSALAEGADADAAATVATRRDGPETFEGTVQAGLEFLSPPIRPKLVEPPSGLSPTAGDTGTGGGHAQAPMATSVQGGQVQSTDAGPGRRGPGDRQWDLGEAVGPRAMLGIGLGGRTPTRTAEAERRLAELQRVAAQAMSVQAQAMEEALTLSQAVELTRTSTGSHAAPLGGASAAAVAAARAPSPPAGREGRPTEVTESPGAGVRRGLFHEPGAAAAAASASAPCTPDKVNLKGGHGGRSESAAGARTAGTPPAARTQARGSEAQAAPWSAPRAQGAGRVARGLGVRVWASRARVMRQGGGEGGREGGGGPHLSVASEAAHGSGEVRRAVSQGRVVQQAGEAGERRVVEVVWDEPFEHEVYEGNQRFTMSCFDVDADAGEGSGLVLLGGVTVAAGKLLASAMRGAGRGDVRLALHDGRGREVGELELFVQICK